LSVFSERIEDVSNPLRNPIIRCIVIGIYWMEYIYEADDDDKKSIIGRGHEADGGCDIFD
jgi:hypothetical protein